jgi:hypothetical protein
MDEMLEAIQAEVTKDAPTTKVETFFKPVLSTRATLALVD